MPIVVNSPFSGKPVKIRDQDINRAVRDEENRIFYVLPKSDGSGYYGSTTRAGGEKEENRYLEMENKTGRSAEQAHAQQVEDLHDATGKKRKGGLTGKLVILVLIIIVAGLVYWGYTNKDKFTNSPAPPNPIPVDGSSVPADAPTE